MTANSPLVKALSFRAFKETKKRRESGRFPKQEQVVPTAATKSVLILLFPVLLAVPFPPGLPVRHPYLVFELFRSSYV